MGRWGDLWRHEGASLTYGDADHELTDWRGRYDWLAAQPSVPQQQVLRDLYHSVNAFFDKSNPAGRPRFKKRRDGYATARWTRNGFKVSGSGIGVGQRDRLAVAAAGGRLALRVVWSRPLPSEPMSVTVSGIGPDGGGPVSCAASRYPTPRWPPPVAPPASTSA